MNLTKETLSIPNPDPQGKTLVITYDMLRIHEAEARVPEISFLSFTKAPELLTKFSLAMQDLGNYLADLGYRESVAKRKLRERRAVVVVEVIPSKLAERKLANNDTNREAIVELDPEYSVSTDILNQIEAAFVLVREKLRAIESAINCTKRVLDTLPNFLLNSNLNTTMYNTNANTNTHVHTHTQEVNDEEFEELRQQFSKDVPPNEALLKAFNNTTEQKLTTTTSSSNLKIGKVKY